MGLPKGLTGGIAGGLGDELAGSTIRRSVGPNTGSADKGVKGGVKDDAGAGVTDPTRTIERSDIPSVRGCGGGTSLGAAATTGIGGSIIWATRTNKINWMSTFLSFIISPLEESIQVTLLLPSKPFLGTTDWFENRTT
jgi:hypothetical protein